MQTMRDFLSAWLVVGALGLVVVGLWGFDAPDTANDVTVACGDGGTQDAVAALQGAEVPRNGWRPSAELTGQTAGNGNRLTSYEVAEERNLEALGPVAGEAAQLAQGSSTNLNPTSMC